MTNDQRWRGFIDFIDEPFVTGWAFDAHNPNLPLLVQFAAAGGETQIVKANLFRQDLKEHGIGDGRHGFVANLQDLGASPGAIEISILGSDCILAKDVHLNTASLRTVIPPLPETFSSLMRLVAAELRAASGSTAQREAKQTRNPNGSPSSLGRRPPSATLLDAAHPERDPEGLISKFLRNEVIRTGEKGLRAKLAGTTKDRLDALLWYIADYSLRWGRSLSVPLSGDQIRFLNHSLPVSDFPASISVALWNLVRRDRPDLLEVTKPEVENEALYWWCFEKTPQLNLEEKLVTPDQASALRAVDPAYYGEFPLSTFMRLHIAKNPELQCLNLNSRAGRLAVWHYFLLLSCKHPHSADFLPRPSLQALLANQSNGHKSFEDNLSFLLQEAPDAHHLAERVRHLVATHTLASRPERGRPGERFTTSVADARSGPKRGVTVIGPIDKTSGLGQATRLSYQILEQSAAPSLSALAFNVEKPALVGFSSRVDYRPYRDPSRINLFHLNADFIPIAFSMLPKSTYDDSYNIGYFFWELNKVPESHRLGLELLDEIWVSSQYVRDIYASVTDKPVVNVGMAVEDLPPHLAPQHDLHQNGAFTFLTTFDSFSFVERKNPLATVRAFKEAFDDENQEVRLIIKTWNRSRVSNAFQVSVWRVLDELIKGDPRIQVIDETFTYEQLLSLKLACDCYVSLHRAEGFGFGMLEAMQLGRPVIATGYSGNMDFCTPENSYLVEYNPISVGYDEYLSVERGSVWADPNIASAAAAMREVVSNPSEAKRRGVRAAQFVKDNFSVQAVASRYRTRLSEIEAGFVQ